MAASGGPRLTDEQRRAITARGVSVALSAGAGCGKTFVLTERFLAQLDPKLGLASARWSPGRRAAARDGPFALNELVAITFTERAAREMRDRVRGACRQRLLDAPDEEVDYWLDLLRQLDSARISTIHSFCGTLLRAHAVEAGLDPRFHVLDESQAETVLYEIIDDELRTRLIARDEAVTELVVEFGLESLRAMVGDLLGGRLDIDWNAWQNVGPGDLVARWQTYHRERVVPSALARLSRSDAFQTVLRLARECVPASATMRERCRALSQRMPNLPESEDAAGDLRAIVEHARVQGGGGKSAWPDEATYEAFRDASGKLRESVKQALVYFEFDPDAAVPAAEAGLRLLSVARSVDDAYRAEKRELAALDFDDLMIHAKRLLTAPEQAGLRERLASGIRLLLVDEFQDTDPLQVELVEALCGEMLTRGKLFFVGDFKQSIYRFRGADPHVFRRLQETTPPDGRLPLTRNFRSQPAILRFVNALFCDDLGPGYEALTPHRLQVTREPAVELLWAPDEFPEQRTGQADRLRRREADWIARRIRAMLDGGEKLVWDGAAAERGEPAARPVRPGDVAVLFRALSDVQHYEEALRRHGIDYYLVGGHAFYAQQEIFDVLNLLRSLASADDEVSLAGALRSPMFACDDETLFWLARQPGGLSGGLFAEATPELDAERRRRVEFARDTLSHLRAMKDRLPIAALLDEALARTGYDAVLLGEFLGERKLGNLRKLIDQARSFDRSGAFTLTDFIAQLSEFVVRQPKEALAATQPEAGDVVRLMTIHQSKGLEFPVVVVADLDRRMHVSPPSAVFTPRLGPLVRTSGPDGFQLHAAVEREEEQAELVRLLYVAATRAADYLILSSGVVELGTARGPWTELLARRFDLLSGEFRGTLPPEFSAPRVRVTTTEPPIATKPSRGASRPSLGKLLDEAIALAGEGEGWVPPHLNPIVPDAAAQRQYSFSRLKGSLHAEAIPAGELRVDEADAAGRASPLDPLGLGTLVHEVLAEVDFAKPDAAALVRRFAPRHLPDAGDALDEPIDLLERFLRSPRAAEIAQAIHLHRELEFLLAWPPGGREDEPRYLQGFIDCLYQDASGRWVVLDYKTNQVTPTTVGAVAAGYEMQMLVYALAVEEITGAPPVDLVLAFLRPGVEHHFAWNKQSRRRVVDLVHRSLAAQLDSGGSRGLANG